MNREELEKARKILASENGKKGGAVNKAKGREYFQWVVSHRKNIKDKKHETS